MYNGTGGYDLGLFQKCHHDIALANLAAIEMIGVVAGLVIITKTPAMPFLFMIIIFYFDCRVIS